MCFIEVPVVTSPFANLTPIYEVDPDADVLLIVSGQPPNHWQALAPQDGLGIRFNVADDQVKPRNVTTSVAQSGLRIKVSSRHLALASRVFKNKLQFGTGKGARQSDGRIHLKLTEEFDSKAVSIVMNVIHSRGSKVPKAVDLETLAQIALVVDRFQLFDAVEVYADRWITNLESSSPDTIDRDPIPWIYISHIFRHATIFQTATKLAAAQSTGPIPTHGLPIREKIIQHIDTTRQALLTRTLTHLHHALDTLASPPPSPSPSPSTTTSTTTTTTAPLLLGELIQSLHPHRLAWPCPTAPFTGISFAAVATAVEAGLVGHRGRERVARERRREKAAAGVKVEVEPWYMKGVGGNQRGDGNGNGGGGNGGEGPRPGWGVVGGIFPITPVASPEPRFGGGGFGGRGDGEGDHVEDAGELRGVVDGLEGLMRFGGEVEGLVLEGRLGYLLY
ncbi:uncharacterized protein B0H64DRAFT_469958 [Chaetomium fimeti]|uniref:BTB domain-containing protein n=1 Tax=Chaetomium fimeti TaxID=1854472 RepID=A0AAE0LW27_9PEZI|nr:hypothetical protein B0H64DRAFT_469958 [Chaetomium fimeti]